MKKKLFNILLCCCCLSMAGAAQVDTSRSHISSHTNNKMIIWLTIGVALVILLLLTKKLVKEIDKKKKHDHL